MTTNATTKIKVSLKKPGNLKQKKNPVNFLEGQKYKTPDESDGLRKFYTSLLKQNPKSKMAKKWCLEHGLLPCPNISIVMKGIKCLKICA